VSDRHRNDIPAEVLDALRYNAASVAPAAARARVFARVQTSVGATASAPNQVVRWGPLGARALRAKLGLVALAAFVVGGATGAALATRWQRPTIERVVYVDRWIERAAPLPSAEAPSVPSPLPSVSATSSRGPRPSPNASATPAQPQLSIERALLDRARKALGAGSLDEAQQALDEHERRFSSGLLSEEREALTIKLFAAMGRGGDARARGAQFRERFPNSLFGPAVDEALESIP
jgi:hypothetical protein